MKQKTLVLLVVVVVVAVLVLGMGSARMATCPGSLVYCPGVGCVSGMDKCMPGATGGPSAVFSKETYVNIPTPKPWSWAPEWPGMGVKSTPPNYGKETFTSCPDGTRTDGPCLLEFPAF